MAPLLSETDAARLAEGIHSFYARALDLLVALRQPSHARSEGGSTGLGLVLPATRDTSLDPWTFGDVTQAPPLVLETVLDLTRLSASESLTFGSTMVNTARKSEIVLERWLFHLNLEDYLVSEGLGEALAFDLEEMGKNLVVLFRCLYATMMFLPAYGLQQSQKLDNAQLRVKVLDGSRPIPSKGRIGLSKSLGGDGGVRTKDLTPIFTPIGSLNVSVSYRSDVDFKVQVNEEAFSNHFERSVGLGFTAGKSFSPAPMVQSHVETTSSGDNLVPKRHRVSITSIESARSRRKSSIRSTSLFKTGSLASSSPPQNQEIQPKPPRPIPMGRDQSSVSLGSRRELSASGESGGSFHEGPKISSSFGTKFKGGGAGAASRHNSLDDRMSHHSNPVLEGLKAKHRLMSSLSVDSDSEDLTGFMRFLDSKPDLRFSGSGFISNDDSISDVFEDSLKNYRSLRNTDIFKDVNYTPAQGSREERTVSPQPPPTAITDKNVSDSVIRLLGGHSPLSSSPLSHGAHPDPYRSIPMAQRNSRGSRSSLHHISPSNTSMKASAMAVASSVGAYGDVRPKRLSNSSSPGTTDSLIERLRRGSIGSVGQAGSGSVMTHGGSPIGSPDPHVAASSQLRYVLSQAMSGSSAPSRRHSSSSNRFLSGELKNLSYGRDVFDSDDEELSGYPLRHSNSPKTIETHNEPLGVPQNLTSDPVRGLNTVQTYTRHRRSDLDDDDELLFEMSDMRS